MAIFSASDIVGDRCLCMDTPGGHCHWAIGPLDNVSHWSGCCGLVGLVFPPIPRQEFIELRDRLIVDPAEHVGEPRLGIDIIELGEGVLNDV